MPDRPDESFPALSARTQRFTLGAPRAVQATAGGGRVLFLRSPAGDDPVTGLWMLDTSTGEERLVADPRALLGEPPGAPAAEQLSEQERARRERSRETASGIVSYAVDAAGRVAAFALAGRLFRVDLVRGSVAELPTDGPVTDPRPDPTGARIAAVCGGQLHVMSGDGSPTLVVADPLAQVSWGSAEFIAAEEMGRHRGYWWSPDGRSLLVARVDTTAVAQWWISDPVDPARPPRPVEYPVAGSANADVTLALVGLDGRRTPVSWDRGGLPYLVAVDWTESGPPTLLLLSRDHRRAEVRSVDVSSGTTALELAQSDLAWVETAPGAPARLSDGRLVSTRDDGETRRLTVEGVPVSPPGLQVLAVVAAADDVVALATTDPRDVQVVRIGADGAVTPLTDGPGVRAASASGDVVAVTESRPDSHEVAVHVLVGGTPRHRIGTRQLPPPFQPRVRLLTVGSRRLHAAVVLPRDQVRPDGPLPVLMDPYGGPGAQTVRSSGRLFLQAQWLADQGFAVVTADGRGTPGRGPVWERAVHRDLAGPVLEDQVEALLGAAARHPGELDLERVAIRGWSFGGYLAALAVLRRPDVFHAAVAGAPVTDWTLYDTFYTERYLGDPRRDPEPYLRSSLVADAASLRRPLLLVHGLVDDNVVVAHTLRLSAALLAAGRDHTVLPLSGMTHLAGDPVVAENLLRLEVGFLHRALADPAGRA